MCRYMYQYVTEVIVVPSDLIIVGTLGVCVFVCVCVCVCVCYCYHSSLPPQESILTGDGPQSKFRSEEFPHIPSHEWSRAQSSGQLD